MIYQLKSPTQQFPPGGFGFKDPKTGFTCNGYEGTPAMHAVKIIAHRRANPNFYPAGEAQWFDQASVVQEIYAQKAASHPHLFKGFPDVTLTPQKEHIVSRVSAPTGQCSCGSSDFSEILCKTCGGRRVTGHRCNKCGKEFKK